MCQKLTIALVMGLLIIAVPPVLGTEDPGIAPPDSNAFGKSLAEWLEAYWRWYYTGSEPDGQGRVEFMSLPSGELISGTGTSDDPAYLRGSIEVSLEPGTPFVLPLFAWIAETYDPDLGIPDDSAIPEDQIQSVVTNTMVTLDGEPILENFWDYYVSARPFDPPVAYPEPTSYGAVGAVSFQGVGFVAAPLAPGTHTITLYEEYILRPGVIEGFDFGVIYDNTWIITVEK